MNDNLTPLAPGQTAAPAATPGAPANPWADAAAPDATPLSASTDALFEAAPDSAASQGADDPWGQSVEASEGLGASDDWLNAGADGGNAGDALTGGSADGFNIAQLWDGSLPVEAWINQGLDWVVQNFRPFFQTVRAPIDATLTSVETLLTSVPTLAMVALLGVLAWQLASRTIAVGAVISLLLVGMLGIWTEAMVTLSLVLTSLVFCLLVGLPLGILLASSDRTQRWTRPFLDAMQTTPAFVYLVPVVMLFGIGNVPGVIVTIVFALPPLVRLINLGIRQVRPDLIEAARAYGASPWQLLLKVQLPLAMPSIMAGINQALMLSLSMVVIASMIAVGGLGQMVLRGIGRLDMGLATVGGLGIVLLAITLDRITQAMGQPRRDARHWWQTGPIGLLLALVRRNRPAPARIVAPQPAEAAKSAQTEPPTATAQAVPAQVTRLTPQTP